MKEDNLERRIKLAMMNPEVVAEQIGDFIVDEVLKSKSTGCVMGLSGGVDSSVTAALAKKAFDKYNQANPDKPLEIVGYMLPSKLNDSKDTIDGERVAKLLNIKYEIINIQPAVSGYEKTNPASFKSCYHCGNLISEVRANVLHQLGAVEKKLVAGTGNLDEDFGVAYYTLFGDGAVHISPIGGLHKRLVRELGLYLGLYEDIVYRTPAAGLEPGQTDFGDLGYDYDVVELVMEGISQGFTYDELAKQSQIIEMVEPQLRMQANPKHKGAADVVYDIRERNCRADWKAKRIHPPTPTITLEYD